MRVSLLAKKMLYSLSPLTGIKVSRWLFPVGTLHRTQLLWRWYKQRSSDYKSHEPESGSLPTSPVEIPLEISRKQIYGCILLAIIMCLSGILFMLVAVHTASVPHRWRYLLTAICCLIIGICWAWRYGVHHTKK